MIRARILAMSIASVVIVTPLLSAQDLSTYRDFQLGMSLIAVAQQVGITPAARVLHQRPALIQELIWQPPRSLGSSRPGDSVRNVLFSFYNGQLFRMVVSYEWERTEGLTAEDMIEALSVTYGPATLPATGIFASLSRVPTGSGRILAHWEDVEHSLDLVRPSYASTFGLVMSSTPLQGLARAASAEAIRLDRQEAPKWASDRQQKQENEDQARQETARRANKTTFRP